MKICRIETCTNWIPENQRGEFTQNGCLCFTEVPDNCPVFKPPSDIGDTPVKEVKEMKASDIQISGNHYKDFSIQPYEFISKNNLDWGQGNIIKYACRYKNKNGAEDLKKIKHYVDLMLQYEYGE